MNLDDSDDDEWTEQSGGVCTWPTRETPERVAIARAKINPEAKVDHINRRYGPRTGPDIGGHGICAKGAILPISLTVCNDISQTTALTSSSRSFTARIDENDLSRNQHDFTSGANPVCRPGIGMPIGIGPDLL